MSSLLQFSAERLQSNDNDSSSFHFIIKKKQDPLVEKVLEALIPDNIQTKDSSSQNLKKSPIEGKDDNKIAANIKQLIIENNRIENNIEEDKKDIETQNFDTSCKVYHSTERKSELPHKYSNRITKKLKKQNDSDPFDLNDIKKENNTVPESENQIRSNFLFDLKMIISNFAQESNLVQNNLITKLFESSSCTRDESNSEACAINSESNQETSGENDDEKDTLFEIIYTT